MSSIPWPRLLALLVLVGAFLVAISIRNIQRPRAPVGVPQTAAGSGYRSFTAEVMHTSNQVVLPDGPEAEAATQAVFDGFRRVEEVLNEWRDGTPLAEVNRKAGTKAVVVPQELFEVIRVGIEIGDATEGGFDITWAALWGLWDFRAESPVVPDPAEVTRRRAWIDYRKVELNPEGSAVRLPEAGMKIGLGGIAKGYALDQGAKILRDRGYMDFMIVSGGQVLASGLRGDRPWRVGIRDPRGDPEDFFAFVDVTNASLSTSGDYERFFIRDGERFHHILDPRTGRPSRGLRSATVICEEAIWADALSTAFMVLGKDAALQVAERLGVETILVDDAGAVHSTEEIAKRLVLR